MAAFTLPASQIFGTALGARESSQVCLHGPGCPHSQKKTVRTFAPVVRAEASEGSSSLGFASVSSSSPPAAGAPPPTTSILFGAGLLAAAGLAYVAVKKDSPKAPAPAFSVPSPLTVASKFAGIGSQSHLPAPSSPLPLPPRSVSQAAPAAMQSISANFPNSIQDEAFVRAVAKELFTLGFTQDNCIALVNTCRDEVCRPLAAYIDGQFGLSFNISGLGGLINCGKTGLGAGMSHSPEFPCDVDGKPRERYVFFAFPHVSVGETGEVGSLLRRGRGKPSNACGALIAIKNDAVKGGPIADDALDAEYITLKKKVLMQPACRNSGPAGPTLVNVTKAALQVITNDLESLIKQTVNPATSDYAVITGIQIHSGAQVPGEPFRMDRLIDYVSPGTMYVVVRGKRYELEVTPGGQGVKAVERVAA